MRNVPCIEGSGYTRGLPTFLRIFSITSPLTNKRGNAKSFMMIVKQEYCSTISFNRSFICLCFRYRHTAHNALMTGTQTSSAVKNRSSYGVTPDRVEQSVFLSFWSNKSVEIQLTAQREKLSMTLSLNLYIT